ncbi:MAG TPA: DUF3343 domain-containing protein [Anaerolineales bacterium]|nr:DUF3343 domain-containing protein [Anaerolineae bacterium]HIQ00880.1 DUF3343 domain-containing protein [Anaerolineales bacterium]
MTSNEQGGTSVQHAVILVHSANHAPKAEKALQQAGITCKLIPVPRRLSSDCGVCLRIRRADQETALRVLEKARVEIEGVHEI